MLVKNPSKSHNSPKIATWETLLKAFSTSTYITTQSRCKLKRVQMSKRMASQPLKVDIPNWWGIGVPKMTLEVIKQCSD